MFGCCGLDQKRKRAHLVPMKNRIEVACPARWLRRLFGVALLLPVLLLLLPGPAAQAGLKRSFPFGPGEKFTFEIYWTVIYAGQATLEVMPDTEIKGVLARHFHAEARTSEFIDTFYKVRDRIDSWTDMDVDRTLKFVQEQREGDYEKDTILDMDWPAMRLDLYGIQGFKNSLDLPGDVLDSLGVLFHFRTHYLFQDRVIGGLVTDGKKIVNGSGVVIRREKVDTPFGELDCFKVEPDTKDIGGVFKKSDNASIEMWFTADERRIPVKIQSEVSVGHFTLELIDVQGVPGWPDKE